MPDHSKILLLFILLSLLWSCEKTDSNSGSCYFSDEIESMYLEDVYQIMARTIYFDSTHPERHNPYFNEDEKSRLLYAIQSVYDLDIAERDTVFEIYAIHTLPLIGLRDISINVDPNSSEIHNLLTGKPTGNYVMDSIIYSFDFEQVTPSMFYPQFAWITISSSKPWNLIPIYEALRKLDFILNAENGGGVMGDGNNLFIRTNDNIVTLDFSIGWGDCPSGCIKRRHWIFETDDQCKKPVLKNAFTQ